MGEFVVEGSCPHRLQMKSIDKPNLMVCLDCYEYLDE